jgi:surfactin synthase thioesterase subunit
VDVATWQTETTGSFHLLEVDGGHLYLQRRKDELVALLDELSRGDK